MFDINPLSTAQRLQEIDAFFAVGATHAKAQRPHRLRLGRIPTSVAAILVLILGSYLVI